VKRRTRALATCLTGLALVAAAATGCTIPGGGGDPGGGPGPVTGNFQKGPNPGPTTGTSNGPFAVQESAIVGGSGFGGGRVYAPSEPGTYAAIALSPGFTARWSSISWLGRRWASHGFVVLGMETITVGDQPASRGSQLNAALSWLTTTSSVRSKVDANRLAVGGHSMGGGGTLEAMRSNPNLKLGIPIAPWNLSSSWGTVRSPVLIVSGSADVIASEGIHADRFYASLGSTEKAQVSLTGGSHFFPQLPNTELSRYGLAWMKRFLDNDTRYSQLACASGGLGYTFRSTCPV
jgi:dienelactone hydrolase